MLQMLENARKLIQAGAPEKALLLIEKHIGNPDLPAGQKLQAFDLYGKASGALGRFQDAQKALEKASAIASAMYSEGLVPAELLINSLDNSARACSLNGQHKKALSLAMQAVEIAKSIFGQDSPQYADALFHLSAPYYHLKEYGEAKDLLERSLAVWQKQKEPVSQIGACLNNLGRIYEEAGDIDTGIYYHAKAVEFRRKLPSLMDLAFSLGNYGIALATGGKLQEGMSAMAESLKVYADAGAEHCADAIALKDNMDRLKQYLGTNL